MGRIVIPKEMRKTLRLKVGDPIEFFAEHDSLLLKKYSPISHMERLGEEVVSTLVESTNKTAMLVDGDSVTLAFGKNKSSFEKKNISSELEKILENRSKVLFRINDGQRTIPLIKGENIDVLEQLIEPIVVNGDLFGALIVLAFDEKESISESDKSTVDFAVELLKRQFE